MRTPFRYSTDSQRAFTLVELLVVIAIIAVLTALAVPAVGGALESSQRSKCASNMKCIGAGIHLYAAEHNGQLPSINCLDPGSTWIEQLQPYLGTNYTTVRVCPADPNAAQKLQTAHATSYLMNERVEPDAFVDENGELCFGNMAMHSIRQCKIDPESAFFSTQFEERSARELERNLRMGECQDTTLLQWIADMTRIDA
jgi:prepilin-type N-terminal cleavage/methylation domain-containing protein